MSKKLEPKTLARTAQLAHIALGDKEEQSYLSDMDKMLALFDELKNLNTEHTKPMYNPYDQSQTLATDTIQEPHTPQARDENMANAPVQEEHFFLVPRVIKENQ